ncbi:MAG: amino acid ABC transporter ATP-binding protein [bacterium]|nr:amino acid ABC transporter ATP-binding protein [bacterium]
MLTLNQVYKNFGDTPILKNISLSVAKGSIVGLAGPSGGGKSTLMRCIQRLESIDSGTIHFTGKSGFIFQDFQLFPHMTVLENLTYGPSLQKKGGDHTNRALKKLETLGIKEKAQSLPHNLSGGQKQRVALARSLMMQPDLLLCDEPTSGLDARTTEDVSQLLKSINTMGVTMIIASHDLPFLEGVADEIILLTDGAIQS